MKKRSITTYEEAVSYILETPKFTAKNTMEDTKAFLHRLGDPDRQMRIIHVAGTNGKGSVCAYMRSILEAAGKRVAVFTSPHLVDVRERFVIDGEMISEEDFLESFLTVYEMLDWEALETEKKAYHPTFFEFMFFIAMIAFPKKNPDFVILETGLGGRLDATNSVSKKEIAVITRIGLDHVEYLGNTEELIAGEKAGIMRKNTPVVYLSVSDSVDAVFLQKAGELGAEAYSVSNRDYGFTGIKNKSIDFSIYSRYYYTMDVSVSTIALYQMENATLAVRAIEVLFRGREITAEHIRTGLKDCFWAGRMEEVRPDIYVDGAHNDDGIRAFVQTVAQDGHKGGRVLLFSVVADKDYTHMADRLVGSGLFDRVVIAHMHTGRALSTEKLQALFAAYPDCEYRLFDSVSGALKEVLETKKEGERVYIAGSLYLAGEIKELLQDDKF